MKFLLSLSLLISTVSYSQSVTPEVVGSTGDYFTSGAAQLSWTLGEVAIESYFGTSNQLTQGFHQPERAMVSIDEFSQELHINAYPNPFIESIQIEIPANTEQVEIVIYDAIGNIVIRRNYSGNSPQTIDFSNLSAGMYVLNVQSAEGILETKKVQKL